MERKHMDNLFPLYAFRVKTMVVKSTTKGALEITHVPHHWLTLQVKLADRGESLENGIRV
jgi:hypothetical protein